MSLKILAIPLVVCVLIYSWHRNDLRRLTRDFARGDAYEGPLERCLMRFPLDEAYTDCVLGADVGGLHISSSADALEKSRRWSFRHHAIKTPLFIPWRCLEIADAKFPMRSYLRFSVPTAEATFFVPRDTGRRLLAMRPSDAAHP